MKSTIKSQIGSLEAINFSASRESNTYGMEIVQTEGDITNSIFYGIANLLKIPGISLREMVVGHILTDQELQDIIANRIAHGKNILICDDSKQRYDSLNDYITLISKAQTFITVVEIAALARSLNRDIIILTPENKFDEILSPLNNGPKSGEPIFFSYVEKNDYRLLAGSENFDYKNALSQIHKSINDRGAQSSASKEKDNCMSALQDIYRSNLDGDLFYKIIKFGGFTPETKDLNITDCYKEKAEYHDIINRIKEHLNNPEVRSQLKDLLACVMKYLKEEIWPTKKFKFIENITMNSDTKNKFIYDYFSEIAFEPEKINSKIKALSLIFSPDKNTHPPLTVSRLDYRSAFNDMSILINSVSEMSPIELYKSYNDCPSFAIESEGKVLLAMAADMYEAGDKESPLNARIVEKDILENYTEYELDEGASNYARQAYQRFCTAAEIASSNNDYKKEASLSILMAISLYIDKNYIGAKISIMIAEYIINKKKCEIENKDPIINNYQGWKKRIWDKIYPSNNKMQNPAKRTIAPEKYAIRLKKIVTTEELLIFPTGKDSLKTKIDSILARIHCPKEAIDQYKEDDNNKKKAEDKSRSEEAFSNSKKGMKLFGIVGAVAGIALFGPIAATGACVLSAAGGVAGGAAVGYGGTMYRTPEGKMGTKHKIAEKLNGIIEKALAEYDKGDFTKFFTELAEQYDDEGKDTLIAFDYNKEYNHLTTFEINTKEFIKTFIAYEFNPVGTACLLYLLSDILINKMPECFNGYSGLNEKIVGILQEIYTSTELSGMAKEIDVKIRKNSGSIPKEYLKEAINNPFITRLEIFKKLSIIDLIFFTSYKNTYTPSKIISYSDSFIALQSSSKETINIELIKKFTKSLGIKDETSSDADIGYGYSNEPNENNNKIITEIEKFLENGKYGAADKMLEENRKETLFCTNIEFWYLRAECYRFLGKYDDAMLMNSQAKSLIRNNENSNIKEKIFAQKAIIENRRKAIGTKYSLKAKSLEETPFFSILYLNGNDERSVISILSCLSEMERVTSTPITRLFKVIIASSKSAIIAIAAAICGQNSLPKYTMGYLLNIFNRQVEEMFSTELLSKIFWNRRMSDLTIGNIIIPAIGGISNKGAFFFRSNINNSYKGIPSEDFLLQDVVLAASSSEDYQFPEYRKRENNTVDSIAPFDHSFSEHKDSISCKVTLPDNKPKPNKNILLLSIGSASVLGKDIVDGFKEEKGDISHSWIISPDDKKEDKTFVYNSARGANLWDERHDKDNLLEKIGVIKTEVSNYKIKKLQNIDTPDNEVEFDTKSSATSLNSKSFTIKAGNNEVLLVPNENVGIEKLLGTFPEVWLKIEKILNNIDNRKKLAIDIRKSLLLDEFKISDKDLYNNWSSINEKRTRNNDEYRRYIFKEFRIHNIDINISVDMEQHETFKETLAKKGKKEAIADIDIILMTINKSNAAIIEFCTRLEVQIEFLKALEKKTIVMRTNALKLAAKALNKKLYIWECISDNNSSMLLQKFCDKTISRKAEDMHVYELSEDNGFSPMTLSYDLPKKTSGLEANQTESSGPKRNDPN